MKPYSLLLSLLLASGSVDSAPLKIALPTEVFVLKEGSGRDVVMANCLMCHSTEYFTSQPPLARAGWQAVVEKMKAKFGAPLPDDQVQAVVDYLTTHYGPEQPAEAETP